MERITVKVGLDIGGLESSAERGRNAIDSITEAMKRIVSMDVIFNLNRISEISPVIPICRAKPPEAPYSKLKPNMPN